MCKKIILIQKRLSVDHRGIAPFHIQDLFSLSYLLRLFDGGAVTPCCSCREKGLKISWQKEGNEEEGVHLDYTDSD